MPEAFHEPAPRCAELFESHCTVRILVRKPTLGQPAEGFSEAFLGEVARGHLKQGTVILIRSHGMPSLARSRSVLGDGPCTTGSRWVPTGRPSNRKWQQGVCYSHYDAYTSLTWRAPVLQHILQIRLDVSRYTYNTAAHITYDVPSSEHEASASNGLSNEHAPGNYIQDQPTNTKQAQAPAGEESRANIVRKSREQEASTDSSARAPLAAWTAGLDLPGPHTKKKADRTSKGQSASFFGQVGMAAASSETSTHISTCFFLHHGCPG